MNRLEKEIEALANLSPAQLRDRWDKVTDGHSVPSVPPHLLMRLLAQRMQERRYGALPALVARRLGRTANADPDCPASPSPTKLTPGTRLVREWNGQTIRVEVLENGFSYDKLTWRSLSEIARHVTGAHWSGPRFFGLTGNG